MKANRPYGPWIAATTIERNAQLRLFCLPYAGGAASIYRGWQSELPEGIHLCPVQLPGREDRISEKPYTRILESAAVLARELHPMLDVPYALFGHSMGALLEFELARSLRRLAAPTPVRMFYSAHRAPQIPRAKPPIHNLPYDAFVEELRRLEGTPEEVLNDRELMEFMSPVVRADFEMIETYIYTEEEPFDSPISVFGGDDDPEFPYEELTPWHVQTRSTTSLRMFPGHHFFIHAVQKAVIEAVVQDLAGFLKR